ncbi:S9 family peptidase [Flavobacterium anhuiense]|uniref:S9 family peptidase n=1 Tax=Flavobacterium anhuiense TaxID=459526 RepID=UPI003D9671E1
MQNISCHYKNYLCRAACFIFWLVICPRISGQTDQKKILTPNEYNLWSFLVPEKISPLGEWSSYRLIYDYKEKDTLFLQRASDLKRISFPSGRAGKFNGELDFGCISKDTFRLVNLRTQKFLLKAGASDFRFSKNQKYAVVFNSTESNKMTMEIMDRSGRTLFYLSDIISYCFDPEMNGIAYSIQKNTGFGVELVLFTDSAIKKKTIAENPAYPYQNLIWKTESIAFIENNESKPSIYSFDIKKEKLRRLDPVSALGFPSEMKISNSMFYNPIPSIDGSKLFFWLKEPQSETMQDDPENVQIWNAKDKLLTDFKKLMPYHTSSEKLAVWNILDNTVLQITGKELPRGFLSADYKYAFIYDPAAYEPQTRQNCPYDLYVLDLESGKKELVLERYLYDDKPQGSPDGKHLCYAKDSQWWIYDLKSKKHTCLTKGISVSFFSEDSNTLEGIPPYGLAGWSNNGEVLLYDKFDIWKISFDGKRTKRLTQGREMEKSYRIKRFDSNIYYDDVHSDQKLIDLEKGFLVTESNRETGETGLGWLNNKNGANEYLWKKKKITQISKAENKNMYMYLEQNFENAPRLVIFDGKEKEIFQSNKQQKQYSWGRNERIDYEVNGIKTKGILYYPPGFKKGRKYPLVLYVYERQFAYFNDYINPTLLAGDGFNIPNFLNREYFVFLPDIVYEYANLHESVTTSVLAAVDAVVAKGDIESSKVGIIGHSFGGYETDLIITQTDRFAAAVAGAAVSDLVSFYLRVGPNLRRPEFFRTENHQFRIGKSLYENMDAYLANSPVMLAAGVNTPLLGWAGEEDRNIHSSQSMEFYLALRRLNREHTMLLYPQEGHELRLMKNQMDLSVRIMQWFDYYLKNGPKEPWMNSNFNR